MTTLNSVQQLIFVNVNKNILFKVRVVSKLVEMESLLKLNAMTETLLMGMDAQVHVRYRRTTGVIHLQALPLVHMFILASKYP